MARLTGGGALLLLGAWMLWALAAYAGGDAPLYFEAAVLPCPFHAGR